MQQNRIIGQYTNKNRGPLLVAIGGMHGNEKAGVLALQSVVEMLNKEPEINPDFQYIGNFLAIKGNLKALNEGKRFIDKDLNRSWTEENIELIQKLDSSQLNAEQNEIKEILALLKEETLNDQPDKIVVLDLHTTSSHGGIFSITTDDEESIQIATELHAPVIKGMLQGVTGSSIHFFSGKNMGIPTTAIAFESGQHEDEFSVKRAIAGVINCMRTIGAVDAYHVENKHDEILKEFSKDLPKVSRIVGKHSIQDNAKFAMLPNYKSFQVIRKGELLAYDSCGEVLSPIDGRILMPFYQKQGEDGFFLIQSDDQ